MLPLNERVLRTRNAEYKEETVYDTMQAWGTLPDKTYMMIAENLIFERWEELTCKGDEVTNKRSEIREQLTARRRGRESEFECTTIEDDWIRVFVDNTNKATQQSTHAAGEVSKA